MTCAVGVNYTYDGDGERVEKSSGTMYWGGGPGDALAESDLSGNLTSEYIFFNGKRIARRDFVRTIDVRFTNDSCSACGGTPVGGGDRNLYVNSVTIGSTTIPVTDPSVVYNTDGCSSISGGILGIYCNGDMYVSTTSSSPDISVNAFGSPDYYVYPQMEMFLNGVLAGSWVVPGSSQNYAVNSVYYYFSDHLGSSNVVTNSQGEIQNESDYYPYGGESQIANSLPSQHYKFTGKERDTESGNDYFGARYYSSAMGRFMSPDWSAGADPVPYAQLGDPQSLNLYGYVLNDPLGAADPNGHAGCKETPELCKAVLDAVTSGGSIQDGWVNRLVKITFGIAHGEEAAKKDLDLFNKYVGFGATNCAGGGSCSDAASQAAATILAGVDSEGISEEPAAERLAALAGEKADIKVYEIIKEGKTVYVGITNNLERRALEHGEELREIVGGLTRAQARGVEQVLIERYGLRGQLRNKINSISPSNPLYGPAKQFGEQLLKSMHGPA